MLFATTCPYPVKKLLNLGCQFQSKIAQSLLHGQANLGRERDARIWFHLFLASHCNHHRNINHQDGTLIHPNLVFSFAGQESVWNASADAERQSGRGVRVTPTNDPSAQQVDLGTDQRNAAVRDDHRQKQGSVPATVDDVSMLLNYWGTR